MDSISRKTSSHKKRKRLICRKRTSIKAPSARSLTPINLQACSNPSRITSTKSYSNHLSKVRPSEGRLIYRKSKIIFLSVKWTPPNLNTKITNNFTIRPLKFMNWRSFTSSLVSSRTTSLWEFMKRKVILKTIKTDKYCNTPTTTKNQWYALSLPNRPLAIRPTTRSISLRCLTGKKR